MRLLQTATLQFKEFFDLDIPRYAILSHRWGAEEVSFKKMRRRSAISGPGIVKIRNFCQLASHRGLEWAWIDTCCIDKRSSAELSEAINSMNNWYASASECYVHLSDVELTLQDLPTHDTYRENTGLRSRFRASSWFQRGWTLQELLAPEGTAVIFFDAHWQQIGNLELLMSDISEVTGIDTVYLGSGKRKLYDVAAPCVATIMSWASRRVTSREEDRTYSLLGLFGVNMYLIYGEGGENAFRRLQIEIMNQRDDESLFAWTSSALFSGLLAPSPDYFCQSGDVRRFYTTGRRSFSMTNKGLQFPIPRRVTPEDDGSILVILNCYRGNPDHPLVLRLIFDKKLIACRVRCSEIDIDTIPSTSSTPNFEALSKDLKDDQIVHVIDPNHLAGAVKLRDDNSLDLRAILIAISTEGQTKPNNGGRSSWFWTT
ncbi:MAG: hypothetical protein Q9181_007488 [Wetmoreana brouardii]